MKKKILSLVIVSAVMSALLCGCAQNTTSSQAETTKAESSQSASSATESKEENAELTMDRVKELVPKTDELYDLYCRCGAKTVEDKEENKITFDGDEDFRYIEVTQFKSIDEMKEEAKKYCTEKYAEETYFKTAFDGIVKTYREKDGKLYVLADSMKLGPNTWDMTSVKKKSDTNGVIVYNINYSDLYQNLKSADFTFVNDNGTYKIDNVVFDLERE